MFVWKVSTVEDIYGYVYCESKWPKGWPISISRKAVFWHASRYVEQATAYVNTLWPKWLMQHSDNALLVHCAQNVLQAWQPFSED